MKIKIVGREIIHGYYLEIPCKNLETLIGICREILKEGYEVYLCEGNIRLY